MSHELFYAAFCTISFQVFVPNTAGPGPFPIEARIPQMNPGSCQGGFGLTSSASVVSSITKAPTLGAVALTVLAMALLWGAWRTLRRPRTGPAVGV